MYGTHSVLDQLALIRNQTAAEYGEQNLADDFARFLAAQNALVDAMVADLVEDTDVRLTSYGTGNRVEMVKADEFTRADAQKPRPAPTDIGFPLEPFQISLQWTRKFLAVATVADLAATMNAAREADERNMRREIQRALFTPINNLTYVDRMVDGVTLPVRRLINADSAPIPEDEFANTFDAATHTHYLANATPTAAAVEAAIATVIEHGVTGEMRLYINRAQEAAISAMANFTAYSQPLVRPGGGSTAVEAIGGPAQPFSLYNRAIGVWNGAVEVWIRPWIPANYWLPIEIDPNKRVLRRRRRTATGNGALTMVANDERYPLRAETLEREFGISVWGREQAAVLYTAGGSYVAPTFA